MQGKNTSWDCRRTQPQAKRRKKFDAVKALTHDDALQYAQGLLHLPDLGPACIVPLACIDKRVLNPACQKARQKLVGGGDRNFTSFVFIQNTVDSGLSMCCLLVIAKGLAALSTRHPIRILGADNVRKQYLAKARSRAGPDRNAHHLKVWQISLHKLAGLEHWHQVSPALTGGDGDHK